MEVTGADNVHITDLYKGNSELRSPALQMCERFAGMCTLFYLHHLTITQMPRHCIPGLYLLYQFLPLPCDNFNVSVSKCMKKLANGWV